MAEDQGRSEMLAQLPTVLDGCLRGLKQASLEQYLTNYKQLHADENKKNDSWMPPSTMAGAWPHLRMSCCSVFQLHGYGPETWTNQIQPLMLRRKPSEQALSRRANLLQKNAQTAPAAASPSYLGCFFSAAAVRPQQRLETHLAPPH